MKLTEEEDRNKAILAELEISKVSATNELDEHLNSAIKEKYALSTDITGNSLTISITEHVVYSLYSDI